MPIIEGTTSDPLLYAGTPVNGTDEVQLLTYTLTGAGSAVATVGAFRIAFDGFRTTALPFDESAANVRTAMRALPSIGALGCSVILTAGPPRTYQITFDGGNMLKRAVPAVTIEDNTLVDGAGIPVDVIVTTTTPGISATGLGSLPGKRLLDTVNGIEYVNVGTALAPVWTRNSGFPSASDGLGLLGVARFTFNPGSIAGERTVGAHGSGVILPQFAVVVGGFLEINTAFASAASTAEIAISVQGANDIQTAAAVSGAPYSTTGLKAITPKAHTPESTGIKLTAAREITVTVSVQDLTAGKLTGFLYYVVSKATA